VLCLCAQARKQREEAEAEEALQREAQRARELEEQIREDAHRQRAERARLNRTRERSESDATETGDTAYVDDGSRIVSFPEEIVWEGLKFAHVKLFHPQKGAPATSVVVPPPS
jgi:eukaryotic translation initiation factor 2-alpha kinase 4